MKISYVKFAILLTTLLLSASGGGYYFGYQSAQRSPNKLAPVVGAIEDKPHEENSTAIDDVKLLMKMAGLQNQVSTLQEKYQRLKDLKGESQINAAATEGFSDLSESVFASLEQVPMELITPSIERFTSIPDDVLKNMPDQRAFVSRLAEVAMEGVVKEAEQNPHPMLGPVDFSKNAKYAESQDVFYNTDLVIFAEFDSYNFNKTEVFVKWFRVDDGKVLLFKQMPIRSDDRNYVWINNHEGMEPGSYRVDVYEISQEMPLLSHGRYRVEKLPDIQ